MSIREDNYSLAAYLATDRCLALYEGLELPDRPYGAVLFVGLSAEPPYEFIFEQVSKYHGNIISGDQKRLICLFEGDLKLATQRACTVALALQAADKEAGLKIGVSCGPISRLAIGDPQIQHFDLIAGATLDRIVERIDLIQGGEILLTAEVTQTLQDLVEVSQWRIHEASSKRFGILDRLTSEAEPARWPEIADELKNDEKLRSWLPHRQSTAIKIATVLKIRFGGLDYEQFDAAIDQLDSYVCWLQAVATQQGANLTEVEVSNDGGYLQIVVGESPHDTQRALRIALALLSPPIEQAEWSRSGGIQIGIGRGDLQTVEYGTSQRRIRFVIGESVELANDLMLFANPNELLVSEPIALANLHGYSWERITNTADIKLFRWLGGRLKLPIHLTEQTYTGPLVARQAELGIVEEKLKELRDQGRGQILVVTGEAGIGKSRFVAEIIRRAIGNQYGLLGYGGEFQTHGVNVSYHGWQSIWRAFFNIDPAKTIEQQLIHLADRLENLDASLVARVPLLSSVLNLNLPDNELTSTLEGQIRKNSLEALLVDCLKAHIYTYSTPLMLVLEDCHWLDSLSHDLLEAIGRAIANLPILMIIAYRPPDIERLQVARVSALAHATEFKLTSLSAEEVGQLIENKLGQLELSSDMLEWLTVRTRGNPFYVEELLKYLQEHDIDLNGLTVGMLDHQEDLIPTNLPGLVLRRIDLLSEGEKAVLKIATIIGRVFQASWVWGSHPESLNSAMAKSYLALLDRLNITPLDKTEPGLAYVFEHAVIRQIAYVSLPQTQRETLHEALAIYLELRYNDSPATLYGLTDLLAYHYGRSTNLPKQRHYFRKAGEAAHAAFANIAAIEYYQKLIPLLESPADLAQITFKLTEVLEAAGRLKEATIALQGMLPQVNMEWQARYELSLGRLLKQQADYSQALKWLNQAQSHVGVADKSLLSSIIEEQAHVYRLQTDFSRARELYMQSLEMRRELGDKRAVSLSLNNLGNSSWEQGDYSAVRLYHQEALAVRHEIGDKQGITSSLNALGNVALYQGDYGMAHSYYQESLLLKREIGDKRGTAILLNNLGLITLYQGLYGAARGYYQESLVLKQEVGDKLGIAFSLNNLGLVAWNQGDYAMADNYYNESLAMCAVIGDKKGIAFSLNNLGLVALYQGKFEAARDYYEQSLALKQELGEKWGIAISLNNMGVLAYVQNNYAEAAHLIHDSLKLSREAGSKQSATEGLAIFTGIILETTADQQKLEQIVQLASVVHEVLSTNNLVLERDARLIYVRTQETLRERLTPEIFEAQWEVGQGLSWEAAVDLALQLT